MHILLLNWRDPNNPASGGAEIVTFEHAKRWVKEGHKVTWFTSSFHNAKRSENLEGVQIERQGSIYTVHLRACIFYLLHSRTVDIVIDEIHGLPFFTPLYVRKPIVFFIHEIAGEIWNSMGAFPINILGRFFEPFFLRLYIRTPVWTDANSTIRELTEYGFDERHCIAIPCPPLNKSLSALPKKENHPTFIFVSRMVKMKGVEDILLAFQAIRSELSDAQLWLIGSGDEQYMNKLKRMAAELHIQHAVTFFGFVSSKIKLLRMRSAHILLHASVKEGWGLVVVEAASQGTPSVVYDVSGLRDSVIQGKTGIITSHNSPHDLARSAIALFRDVSEYRRMQRNCLDWSASHTWETVTKKSLALLHSLKKSI